MIKRTRFFLTAVLVGAIGFAALSANAAGRPYTFDGAPSSPLPISQTPHYTELDVQVHSRDSSSWQTLPAIQAQHGADCSAPPATHTNTSYEGSVYQCAGHIMTAINGSAGYAEIVLTPNLLFDFTNGGSVTFDISTERMSGRDWWDLTIAPYNQALALPLLSSAQSVDLNGTSLNAIHIGIDNGEGAPILRLVENGVDSCPLPNQCAGWAVWPANAQIPGSVNQSAARQPFKLTIANGRMKFERLASETAPALVFWDVAATASFNVGVVQFGHHSYTPTKDGAGVPATWHWDNLDAQPSTPFTIVHTTPRATSGGTVTFDSPAPAGASLRFSAICKPTVNGVALNRQASALVGESIHPEHFSSYSVPVPAGSTSAAISFGPDDWYSGPCLGKDFTIWSLNLSSSTPTVAPSSTSTPPATPTATATATLTPTVASTATATLTPTATATPVPPTATATNTPLPTAPPSPTPTATPPSQPWWCRWFPWWCR